jgi:hypothetical protein
MIRMPVKAGDELDAWCTKCRMDLLHRVVAVVASSAKRVECKTCHTQHNYRAPKSGSAERTSPAAKRAPTQRTAKASAAGPSKAASEWQRYVTGKSGADFRAYSISQRFEPSDLLRHKTFGEGYVLDVLQDNKISVAFRDGTKVLIHART